MAAVGWLAVHVWPAAAVAEPSRPEFVVSGFDLGAVEQVRASEKDLAAEWAGREWCSAKPGPGKAGGWAVVPAGVDPKQWVSVVTVGFGQRAAAYAFQFTGPAAGARLIAHVPHRKAGPAGAERWYSPFPKLADGFRVGHAAAAKAAPPPALQFEVVLADPKKVAGPDEALTLAPDKVLPPMQAIATAAACDAGWAPTPRVAAARARVEVRVLDQACAFRVTFVRDGRETVLTRDRVPWDETHDQLALLLSLPVTRPAVADFARPAPDRVELLGVEANRIVCVADDELTALDAATGAEAWRLRVPQSKTATAKRVERYAARRDAAGKLRLYRLATTFAEIAVADGTVTPLAPAAVTAFDAGPAGEVAVVQAGKLSLMAKGKDRWAAPAGDVIVAGPRLDADRVLAGTASGDLVAWARADGRELWRTPLGKRLWGPVTPAGRLRLVFAVEDETLFAVDPADGSVKWRFIAGDTLAQPPAEFDGSVVVVTKSNRIARLDPATGAVAAEAEWPTWVVAAEPVAVGGNPRLAVADVTGRLSLVGPDLKKTWETTLMTRGTGRPATAVTPPVWKGKPKPAKGGDDLLDTIAADAAGAKPYLLATDAAGFLYKLDVGGGK